MHQLPKNKITENSYSCFSKECKKKNGRLSIKHTEPKSDWQFQIQQIKQYRINKYFKKVKMKNAKDERKYKYIKLPFSRNSVNIKSIFRKVFKDEIRIIFISKKVRQLFL